MEQIINKEPIKVQPNPTLVDRPFNPVDLDGDGLPDNPRGGRTEPELREPVTDDDFGVTPDSETNSQDSVNQSETRVDVTTDIANSFGEYGQVFSEIIKQLETFFTQGRETADYVNRNPTSQNPFAAWMMAISGIADKIGDGTEQTNLTNALNQMMAFYMQQVSAGMQNQFNVQQWQVQNEYNSPAEQLKRLSAAGLNPLHFFDSGSSGSSSSVTASSGSAPNAAPAALGKTKAERVLGGIGTAVDVGKTIASAAIGGKEAAMQAAQLPGIIAKQAQDVVESEQRVGSMKAQQALNDQEARNLAQTEAFNQQMHPKLLKAQDNLLRLQSIDEVIKGQVSDEKAAEIESLVANTKLAVQDFFFRERINPEKLKFTDAQVKHTFSLINKEDSITSLNEIRADFQKNYGIPAESNIAYYLSQRLISGSMSQKEFDTFLRSLLRISGMEGKIGITSSLPMVGQAFKQLIDIFVDVEESDVEGVKEYNRLGNQMKNATDNVKRNLNEYSVDEINAVNGL